MKHVGIGGAGVWGIAKDNSLWLRNGSVGHTATSLGDAWTKVQVGPVALYNQCIWCLARLLPSSVCQLDQTVFGVWT